MRRLAALVALIALLTAAAGPSLAIVVEREASDEDHPGCPWKGGGPCPHGHDMDVAGPAVTPCPADGATSPAAVSSLRVFPPRDVATLEVDPRIRAAGRFRARPVSSRSPAEPDPPPPRAASAS